MPKGRTATYRRAVMQRTESSVARRLLVCPQSERLEWLLDGLDGCLVPSPYQDPVAWSESHILFDKTSGNGSLGHLDFSRSPYLRDVVACAETDAVGLKEVTFVAPEQMGKTLSWSCALLWHCIYHPSVKLVYYTSEPKSALVSETKIVPMLRLIPDFAPMLALKGSIMKNEYRLGGSIVRFGGVGTRISSISSPFLVADEVDDWLQLGTTDSLADLRKRARTFEHAVLYKVCTVKGTAGSSRIWREFMDSSRGYYYLRCQGCGGLTIRSSDVHHLRFETSPSANKLLHDSPIKGSERLICPVCGFVHTEAEHRLAMIQQGAYIHERPELTATNVGFQCGLLASTFPSASWHAIATAQANAGTTSSEERQVYFDNSVRGLPHVSRRLQAKSDSALHEHAVDEPSEDIQWRFLSADTQDACFFYVIRGMDIRKNTWLLACGEAKDTSELITLAEKWKCLACIVDEGGHRQAEIRQVLCTRSGWYSYKGSTNIHSHYITSKDFERCIIGQAKYYNVELLKKMYASNHTPAEYWYTVRDVMTEEYRHHMSAWMPNASKIGGDELENWVHREHHPDHLWDAEKMMLVIIDYSWNTAIKPYITHLMEGR